MTKLVVNLQQQCTKAKINFEILCYDDDSRAGIKNKNKPISQLFGVSYVELNENKGRAGIRNALAKYSNHNFLLFIDADSKVPNKSYIKNYLPYLKGDTVIYGGRSYVTRKPTAKSKIFHWTYGSKREALSAKKRNKRPYLSFMSNNFVVPRKIFDMIKFDAEHEGYGYEDTLFATQLARKNIPVRHIDNPLTHTGIEKVDVFLAKTRNALDNLISMHEKNEILETRLILFYLQLRKLRLNKVLFQYIDKRMEKIEKNLHGVNPNMRYFDFWKLHYFMKHISSN